ncbi:hypothetical protein ABZ491_13510 [Micromonospora rifamycinica]
MAALDASGRIADSGVVRALGWVPGTRLHIHEGAGLVVCWSLTKLRDYG